MKRSFLFDQDSGRLGTDLGNVENQRIKMATDTQKKTKKNIITRVRDLTPIKDAKGGYKADGGYKGAYKADGG